MLSYLLVIDMQNDFIDGPLGTPEARAVVPHVVRRMEDARREGRTLLFTQDTHDEGRYLATSEGRHLPVLHCLDGSEGWQLHEKIAPYAAESLKKHVFFSEEMLNVLKGVADKDGSNLDLALCGLCTDICVVSNALILRAFFPEAVIRVYAGACAGVTKEAHDAALVVMRACQIEVEC